MAHKLELHIWDVAMQKTKNGCPPEWVDAVWRLNSPTIYKLCEAKCKSSEDAKDLFQTVALKFCQNAEKLKERASALPWLITVVKTSFCDMVAEKHSTYSFSELNKNGDFVNLECQTIFENANSDEGFGQCEKMIEVLNPLEKLIFTMSFVGDMSTDEISTVVGLSSNAIRKRKHLALLKMRKNIGKSL